MRLLVKSALALVAALVVAAILAAARSRAREASRPSSKHARTVRSLRGKMIAEARDVLREVDNARGFTPSGYVSYDDAPVILLRYRTPTQGTVGVFLVDDRMIYKRIIWSRHVGSLYDVWQAEIGFAQQHVPRLIANFSVRLSETLIAREVKDGFQLAVARAVGSSGFTQEDMSDVRVVAALEEVAKLHAALWGLGWPRKGGWWHFERMHASNFVALSKEGCLWHRVRLAARAISLRLLADPTQTLLHGDLHSGNIFFTHDKSAGRINGTLIDFGQTGTGAAAKDLAYMFGVVGVDGDEARELRMLRTYHTHLRDFLGRAGVAAPSFEVLLESYSFAYVDYCKTFRAGLSQKARSEPRAAVRYGNMERRTRLLLNAIDDGKALANESSYVEAVFRRMPPPGYVFDTDVPPPGVAPNDWFWERPDYKAFAAKPGRC